MPTPRSPRLPDISLFSTGVHLQSSTMFLSGEVNLGMVDMTMRAVHLFDSMPMDDPVTVYLCTGGGDRTYGLGIYDLLRHCKRPVRIVGVGECNSMGSVILQAGNQRDLLPNCHVVLHPGFIGTGPEDHDEQHQAVVVRLLEERARFIQILADRMGLTVKKFLADYRWDTSLSPAKAVALGLADRVL